jgi:hypothetical protein
MHKPAPQQQPRIFCKPSPKSGRRGRRIGPRPRTRYGLHSLTQKLCQWTAAWGRACAKARTQKSLVEDFSSPGMHLLVHPATTDFRPPRLSAEIAGFVSKFSASAYALGTKDLLQLRKLGVWAITGLSLSPHVAGRQSSEETEMTLKCFYLRPRRFLENPEARSCVPI